MKLSAYLSLALLAVLLQVASCIQCSENNLYPECKKITDTFEKALLEGELNCFALDQMFHPGNKHPKPSFSIGYILYFPVEQENKTLQQHIAKIRGWCKSSTYTIVNTAAFHTLSTGLPYLYHTAITQQYIEGTMIFLHLPKSNYTLTDELIDYGLDYITPWLKLYSKKKDESTAMNYNDADKGYLCELIDYNWYLTAFAIIVTIATMFISVGVLYWLLDNKSNQDTKNIKTAFFLALGLIAFVINVVDIAYLIIVASYYLNFTPFGTNDTIFNFAQKELDKINFEDAHLGTKVSEIVVSLLVFFVGGIIGIVILLKCRNDLFETENTKTAKSNCLKCIYGFCCGNYFWLSFLLGLNVVPTFMMVFAEPVKTVSVLVTFLTLVTSVVMGLALIIFQIRNYRKWPEVKEFFLLFVLAAILLVFSLVMVLFLVTLAHATKNNTSNISQVFLSFGAATLPGLVGYMIKQILDKGEHRTSRGTNTEPDDSKGKYQTIPGTDTERQGLLNNVV